jgi:hypothetical protein
VHDNVAKSLQAVQDIVRQFDHVREVRTFGDRLPCSVLPTIVVVVPCSAGGNGGGGSHPLSLRVRF